MAWLIETRTVSARLAASLLFSIVATIGALLYFDHMGRPPSKPDAGLIQSLEMFRGSRRPAASVVIVHLGHGGNAAARSAPVRRAVLAELVRCASRKGAKAVTILGCLEGPSPYGHSDDLALVDACRTAGNVVVEARRPIPGMKPHVGQWTCEPFAPIHAVAAGVGDLAILSEGGTGWTIRVYGITGSPPWWGLCVETVRVGMRLSRGDVRASKDCLMLGARSVALADAELIVNFRGPRGAIPTLNATELLGGSPKLDLLKGAYVIVVGDREHEHSLGVPFGAKRGELDGEMGVDEILGNGIETLAGGIAIKWLKLPATLSITFGECLVFALVILFSRWIIVALPTLYGLLFLKDRIEAFFFSKCIAMDTAYAATALLPCICLSLVMRLILFLYFIDPESGEHVEDSHAKGGRGT
jgi:hypothetical protein